MITTKDAVWVPPPEPSVTFTLELWGWMVWPVAAVASWPTSTRADASSAEELELV